MNVTKCDLCEKYVEDNNVVVAGRRFLGPERIEVCESCGKPILEFLIKHKVVEKTKIKKS